MEKKILYPFLLILFIACRHEGGDVSGSSVLGGAAYIINPWDSFPAQPLAGQSILLQRLSDTTSKMYIFSDTTDGSGGFTFNYLYNDVQYRIYAETHQNTRWDTDILFTAMHQGLADKNVALVLTPDVSTQNGLFFICNDSVTTGTPGVMPHDSIYVYTSSVLAGADSAAVSGAGASLLIVSNMNGNAFKMNMPANRPLYINSACTFGNNRYVSRYTQTSLASKGVDTIRLRLLSR